MVFGHQSKTVVLHCETSPPTADLDLWRFGLKIVGNIWDNVSIHLNKIYNIGLVVFSYFNVEKFIL